MEKNYVSDQCWKLRRGQAVLAEDLVGEGAVKGGDQFDEPDREGGRCAILGAAMRYGRRFLYFVELFEINC